MKQARAFTDTAILTICRFSGEDYDRTGQPHDGDYFLSFEEEHMVKKVLAAFPRVAVVLNTGGMMDTLWFRDNPAVGAALLTEDGKVFIGCNIENAAYGNTLCAERTALVKAVSEGYRKFTKIAIASSGSAPYPCGACRQSLYEFAPGLEVLVTWDGHVERAPLSELLPHGFGPSSLGK